MNLNGKKSAALKRFAVALFTGTLLVAGLSACAHRGDGPSMARSAEDAARMKTKMVDRVSTTLELTAEQKAKLTVLADKLAEQRAAMRGAAANPRGDVMGLIAGEKFDRSKAQSLVTEKAAAVTAKSPEVITAMGDFYDSLTPVQQQKVRDFASKGRRGWRS